MDYKQKSEEFRISIRRKNLTQKIAAMRAKQTEPYSLQNPQAVIARIKTLLSTPDQLELYRCIAEVKMASQDPQVMAVLKTQFETFYRCILEVDAVFGGKGKASTDEVERAFNDLSTILINITSEEFINFSEQITEDIATPLIRNLRSSNREISTLWLIANLLYRHNNLSLHFMSMLVRWGIIPYLKGRVDVAFSSDSEMTIYYYFLGAFAANMDALSFPQYREALTVLDTLAQLQIQELYWYLLDGLIEHASFFNAFKYEIFATKLLNKCDGYCKSKKTRFVLKYLELISRFLQGESQLLHRTPEQSRRKILSEQYERLKNNQIMKNLQFCLENRSPEVKRLLFEVGYMLVALYPRQISFIDEYYYLTLAEELKIVEKYEENTVVWFLKYFRGLIGSLLREGSIGRNQEYTEAFVKFVESTGLFDKVNYLMQHFDRSHQLLSVAMDVIAFLMEYDIPAVNAALKRAKLVPTLEKLEIESMEVSHKREVLLKVLENEGL